MTRYPSAQAPGSSKTRQQQLIQVNPNQFSYLNQHITPPPNIDSYNTAVQPSVSFDQPKPIDLNQNKKQATNGRVNLSICIDTSEDVKQAKTQQNVA